jgi:NAD(P)-dependent dehydrogenase (short-subunit alcohol dehydrogenase family)
LRQIIVEDLAQSEAAKHWIDEAVDRNGRLDVLYNNASSVHFAPITRQNAGWLIAAAQNTEINRTVK